jgi:hypothetical protein
MRNSSMISGPYHKGLRPRVFLSELTSFYQSKKMTSAAGKQYNVAFGNKAL